MTQRFALTLCLALFWISMALGESVAAEGDPPVRLEFRQSEVPPTVRVALTGLRRETVQQLATDDLDRDAWTRILAVSVANNADAPAPAAPAPAMLGEYRIENDSILFEPRFALRPGLTYRAVFDPAALPGADRVPGRPVTAEFSLPKPKPAAPTRVAAVYPTRDTLPENQLKFYLHFSAAMGRGEAYERVRLLDSEGERIEYPFLELGEELWDPSGRRFTLFFDPGRIKRGLQPRELFGPALEEGRSYALVIDQSWRDAQGQPLAGRFTKKFKVTAPDDTQPDPSRWKIASPRAGTRDPLGVTFEEPLDHGMLQRVLVVHDPAGESLAGRIEVDRHETRWRFHPERDWAAGRHHLAVETTLEDLAGNSIGRPFEVDVVRPIEREIERTSVSLPFDTCSDER